MRKSLIILKPALSMIPPCPKCSETMKVAELARRSFICEPCREICQWLDVDDLKNGLPWGDFYKPNSNRTTDTERVNRRSVTPSSILLSPNHRDDLFDILD